MRITKEEIQHLAQLVRLKLSAQGGSASGGKDEEIKKYQKQISEILDYVSKLQKVSTASVQPCTGGTDLENVLREDEAKESGKETREKLLAAAPQRAGNLIKTKGIFNFKK